MPKPNPKKHTFDAQVQSALAGTRILPQSMGTDSERRTHPHPKRKSPPSQPDTGIVEKLIDFFKTMD